MKKKKSITSVTRKKGRLKGSNEKPKPKARRTVPVPETLGELIWEINTWPPKMEFIEMDEIQNDGVSEIINELRSGAISIESFREKKREMLIRLYRRRISLIPENQEDRRKFMVDHIKRIESADLSKVSEYWRNTFYLFMARDELRQIALAFEQTRSLMPHKTKADAEFCSAMNNNVAWIPLRKAVVFWGTITDTGRFLIYRDRLESALTEEGVDVTRIRQCPICQELYWAGRWDQPSCSKKCNQVRRTREWRASYPEKYKVQRYYHKERKVN